MAGAGSVVFHAPPRRLRGLAILLLAWAVVIAALVALGPSDNRLVGVLAGLIVLAWAGWILLRSARKAPVLEISSEGFVYRRIGTVLVGWDRITRIRRLRAGEADGAESATVDSLKLEFDAAKGDPRTSNAKGRRWRQTFEAGVIRIGQDTVDAPLNEVLSAMRRVYRGPVD